MTVQTFRDLLSAQPFKPFRLIMSSGESYEVRHPEMAMLLKNDVVVGLGDEGDGIPGRFRTCPIVNIANVEIITPAMVW